MKRFLVLIIAVLAIAAIWTAGWLYVAGLISDEAQRLAQADGVTQPRIVCEEFSVSGYPFHFSPICTGAEISSGDLTLTTPRVSATALFYRPAHLQIFVTSPARLSDAFTGSAHQLAWDNLRASLRLENNRLARFSAIGDNLVHTDALFGETTLGSADHFELHLVDATPPDTPSTGGAVLDIFARLDGVVAEGFEIVNGAATLDARLTGVPPLDLLGRSDVMRLWQTADGTLTLRNVTAQDQGTEISASGEAFLDGTGRVNGTLSVSSRGLVERFEGLAEDPVAALFLGTPAADGTYSQNISVRAGTVFIGILPVMGLDPLF